MITPYEQYPKLAKILGVNDLYFKREDLHPYGSHKGRSIPVMIDRYYTLGSRNFAISSSGNAALAAALYTIELNKKNLADEKTLAIKNPPEDKRADTISLTIFVGQNISPSKLDKIKNAISGEAKITENSSTTNKSDTTDPHIKILVKERPLQALSEAIREGATSLRQSSDDTALIGYKPLAEEIANIPRVGAVFIGSSSGSTAQALATYFIENKLPIQVHIVQTSATHALVDAFVVCDKEEDTSLADAIVDKTALRKNILVPLIKQTGGTGWCATNEDIETVLGLVKSYTGLTISTNSALSVVGAMKAGHIGYEIKGSVVCIITGE